MKLERLTDCETIIKKLKIVEELLYEIYME